MGRKNAPTLPGLIAGIISFAAIIVLHEYGGMDWVKISGIAALLFFTVFKMVKGVLKA